MSVYQALDDYENEEELKDEINEGINREYNLFRLFLYYVILGFLSWNIFYFIFTSSWFNIKVITINGNNYIENDIILTQGGLENPINIFHFDTEISCEKLLKNPWIKDIFIKKIYPKQIVINIEERKPGALLYSNSFYYLVTVEGVILTKTNEFNNEFNQFVITGLNIDSKKPGEIIQDNAYTEAQKVIYALKNLFPDQFSKIEVISKEEFILFHRHNDLKVRIGNAEQLISQWYLLESALQKVSNESLQLQEINMKYQERLLMIMEE